MEPFTLLALTTWAWTALSTAANTVGGDAYEGLKNVLANKFEKYLGYTKDGKEEVFKEMLKETLENDPNLVKQISELAKQFPQSPSTQTNNTITGNISIANITAGGNVQTGHKIKSNPIK